MLREARLSKILEVVNEKKYVSLNDLMEITGASESSIRSDLVYLAEEGKIVRLHGGAQAIEDYSSIHELSVEAKMEMQIEEKKLIAGYAAKLVKDNCDFIATIPMKGKVNSLNDSVATAIIVFEAIKKR